MKEKGILGYITPNKFIKAGYGKNLRTYLTQFDIQQIIDFGELPVFSDAATFPCIFIVQKETVKDSKVRFVKINSLAFDSLSIEADIKGFDVSINQLLPDNWQLTNDATTTIFAKMKANAQELSKYLDTKIQYGIKTGFNEAFILDEKTKNKLIAQTPEAAEIIKPFVVGDNIRFYKIDYENKYLILTKIGVDIKRYPSVFEHLKEYQTQLEKRYDKGKFWWELRACDYYNDFKKPKIIYPVIAKESRFTFDTEGYYFNDKAFMIPSDDKSLLAILNSKLIWFYLKKVCSVLGDEEKGGRLELRSIYLKDLPIAKTNDKQKQFLASKAEDMLSLTSNLDKKSTRFIKLFTSMGNPMGLNPLKSESKSESKSASKSASMSGLKPELELTVNKKLETWYNLTFGEFRKELEKQKIAIPIRELMDYQDLFDTNAAQIKELQTKINNTEKAIDKLVYALYDLTDEEIQIIENQ